MNATVSLRGPVFISVLAALVAVLLFAGSYALAVTGPAAQVGSGEPQSEAQQEIWGDVDCKNGVTTRDSQALLRKVLEQPPLSQEGDCPAIGTSVTFDGNPPTSTPSPSPANELGPYSGNNKKFSDEFCVATNFVTIEFTVAGSAFVYLRAVGSGSLVDFDLVSGDGSTQLLTDGPGCYFLEIDGGGDAYTVWISW